MKESDRSLPAQAPGLSFCVLEDRVIVLDPAQGLYFSLSSELGRLLQSLPVFTSQTDIRKTSDNHVVEFSLPQRQLIQNLSDAGLATSTPGTVKRLSSSAEYFISDDLKVWGTLAELTQSGGGSGTSSGGGPGMTFPPN